MKWHDKVGTRLGNEQKKERTFTGKIFRTGISTRNVTEQGIDGGEERNRKEQYNINKDVEKKRTKSWKNIGNK